MNELKSCPFCGSEAEVKGPGLSKRLFGDHYCVIFCSNKDCPAGCQVEANSEAEAEGLWNWRYNEVEEELLQIEKDGYDDVNPLAAKGALGW